MLNGIVDLVEMAALLDYMHLLKNASTFNFAITIFLDKFANIFSFLYRRVLYV